MATHARAEHGSPMTLELLSLGGFTLSLAGFAAAFEEQSPRLDRTRWWCLALTGSVLWICLIGQVAAWVTVVSCLGFLISLVGVSLAAYAEPDAADDEPSWWPEFERDFRDYVRRGLPTKGTKGTE
jgi:hypothetical protein